MNTHWLLSVLLINTASQNRTSAAALFTLTLFRCGRIVHGATYFDDACQWPWHAFRGRAAKTLDTAGRTVNNCTAWRRQTEQTHIGQSIYRRLCDRLRTVVRRAAVCSSVSQLRQHRTWSHFADWCAMLWSGCSGLCCSLTQLFLFPPSIGLSLHKTMQLNSASNSLHPEYTVCWVSRTNAVWVTAAVVWLASRLLNSRSVDWRTPICWQPSRVAGSTRCVHRQTHLVRIRYRWYGDGAGNTVEENSSVFSLIRMH